jgi:hypothetical protein
MCKGSGANPQLIKNNKYAQEARKWAVENESHIEVWLIVSKVN